MSNHHNNKTGRGISPEQGKSHTEDHSLWSRRTFLRQLGVAGSFSFLLGRFPINAIAGSPLALALNATNDERILVLIRLKGGNDGLNTIIPVFNYGIYQQQRPSIAVPNNQIISLSAELGMNSAMQPLENRWLDGQMKVVNNVGYPDHNLSHFRSTDLWASARNADEDADSGWLGRLLNQEFPDFLSNPPQDPPAIQIGGAGNLVFFNEDEVNMSVQVTNPEQLESIALTGQLYDPTAVPFCYYGEQLSYLRTVANATFRYAQVISQAYQNGANNGAPYDGSLGAQLALVARLIKGGLRTRLYMVELDGFDTHASQENNHPNLLNSLATAVDAFYEDLADGAHDQRVLSMTFSEFGRRIEQNSSSGTDHGTAAPLMLFGPGLNGNGFLGGLPDLVNTDENGNLHFEVDFRSIYATVLEQWLCVEPDLVDEVLGQTFDRLPGLGLDCLAVGTQAPIAAFNPELTAYMRGGELYISYELPATMPVQLMLFNMLGQPLRQIFSGVQASGLQEHRIPLSDINWAAGVYVCSLLAGSHTVSKPIALVNR